MPNKASSQHIPYLDDFLLNLQSNNYSKETLYNYERDLNVFENFLNDLNISFDKINKRTILNYKAYLTSQDRKTAKLDPSIKKLGSFSMNRMLSSLRSYMKFLTDIDYKIPIPPDAIKLIKTEKKHLRVGAFEEIKRLIEAPMEIEKNKKIALRNRAMLEVLFSTGVRISELMSIKIPDIDKNGRIFVRGKGKKERFVYLTPRAQQCIKKYLEIRQNIGSTFLFLPYRGTNVNNKNKKMSTNYLQERLKRYREILGLNMPISAHGLRHAFATYMAESGASPVAIQIMLGHESLDTTTCYIQASDRYAEKSHKKFHPLKE